MPALAAQAEKARLSGWAADGPSELASFRAAYPGYDDTGALDGLRASEYRYLDAEGQIYLDYTGAGLPAGRSPRSACRPAGTPWPAARPRSRTARPAS